MFFFLRNTLLGQELQSLSHYVEPEGVYLQGLPRPTEPSDPVSSSSRSKRWEDQSVLWILYSDDSGDYSKSLGA
jgi:hypothetical protein